jgi:hypothetical protein
MLLTPTMLKKLSIREILELTKTYNIAVNLKGAQIIRDKLKNEK